MTYSDGGQYIDMDFFVWPRANAGYCIKNEADEDVLDVFKVSARDPIKGTITLGHTDDAGLFIVERPDTTSYISMKPLDEESALFREFADLNGSPDSFIEFADQHGLLLRSHRLNLWDGMVNKSIGADLLSSWGYEHWILKKAIEVWDLLQDKGEYHKLHRLVKWDKSGFYVEARDKDRAYLASSSVSTQDQAFPRFKPGDAFLPAQYFVQTQINRKLREYRVNPMLLMSTGNKLKQYFVPENLLAAMWFQFFQAVTGEKRYKRCDICKKWVDVTDKNETWTTHSTCANRKRVAKSRKKGKAFQMHTNGMSIEDIAVKLRIDAKWVIEWLREEGLING